MAFRVTTPPSVEPLLVTDAVVKQALRVIDQEEDAFISMLLARAREAAEQYCWRALITQQITLVMDKFPSPGLETASSNWYGPAWGVTPGPLTVAKPSGITGMEIYLPRPPLQSVQAITYYDAGGVLQTLAPSAYLVDTFAEPGRITPAPGVVWPATQNRANAVTIAYTAGYGNTAAAVPLAIQQWMLLLTATLYENRELVAVMERGAVAELPYIQGLLQPYAVRIAGAPDYW